MAKNDEQELKLPKKSDVKPKGKKTDIKAPKGDKVVPSEPAAVAVKPAEKGSEAVTSEMTTATSRRRFNFDGLKNRTLLIRAGIILVGLVVLVTIVFGVLVYAYKSESTAVKVVSGVIPYPVEKVNNTFVSYHDYLFEVDANKRAYQNNAKLNNQPAVDFNSADGKKMVIQIKQHAMDKLKSDAVTAQLASQNKVKVTDKDVNDLLSQLYKQYGGKETLLKTLKSIYGWNIGDLKHVVQKQLLTKKLQDKITADPKLDAQAKAKAVDVVAKVRAGGDFATLAKQYSQSSDASSGGDLGTFTKGQVPTEVQTAVDALPVGGISDPVKSQYGYEIIKVNGKTDTNYQASHILIETIDYTTWFNDQLKKAKVNSYIKV